ncbi:hypothetical protein [Microbulbifer mangrovi]|uniref:hypothetical protein n=1 Tax=Microbulbifer mangrovi TaxID=927787 RepID=UPI0013017412|nr:hypothetical protein [Microbulbifer mangrovi]
MKELNSVELSGVFGGDGVDGPKGDTNCVVVTVDTGQACEYVISCGPTDKA